MNLIVFSKQDLSSNNTLVLSDDRFTHIVNTHNAKSGDTVRVGELNGKMGQGIITKLSEDSVEIDFTLDQEPPKKLPLTVVLALPRPKMIRRILRSAAELGIQRLYIINSYKVEKSYWSSPLICEDKVQSYLLEGLQQAKDTVLPEVQFNKRFKPFVEDELPDIIEGTTALVAHPGIGSSCPHGLDKSITLAIGPEGGFIDYEVEKLVEAGCEPIHLGKRILKVENALTALVSKLFT